LQQTRTQSVTNETDDKQSGETGTQEKLNKMSKQGSLKKNKLDGLLLYV